jgi:threonine aldolase
LKKDHLHATQIADAVAKKDFVKLLLPVETNIIIFELNDSLPAPELVSKLNEKNILSYAIAPNRVRFVVHLDVTKEMVGRTIEVIEKL